MAAIAGRTETRGAAPGLGRPALAVIALALVSGLAACERQVFLPGERFDVRTPLVQTITDADGTSPAARAAQADRELPVSLGAARNLSDWAQPHANTANNPGHLALSSAPSLLWSVDIGAGNSRRARISADPVVASGRIFTLDSQGQVSAVSPGGEVLWSRSLVPAGTTPEAASGGGLSFGAGRLFVVTSLGRLHALDPETGNEAWAQRLDAPAAGAPTVSGNTVYVVNRRNEAFAIDAGNGRIRWQVSSAPVAGFFQGGASPAFAGGSVIFPFGSGELVAYSSGGALLWSAGLADGRDGAARASITDVSSDPVVAGGTVYAANQAGQIVALERGSGQVRWAAREGAYSPAVPVGNAVFAVTDRAELVRLDARTGQRVWLAELPGYTTDRPRRIRDITPHYGPLLAGGRLLIASGDGVMRFFDPVSGAAAGQVALPGGAASHPVIVGGTLYIVTGDGRLSAFR
ncbi:MAG: PQQ-binding-like beta-propeller repeat protein [Rhodobacteraceae bacterium]|nr:PQQ-binding-like beta-propeller repeat protein [Paracoccaceae bacterium]